MQADQGAKWTPILIGLGVAAIMFVFGVLFCCVFLKKRNNSYQVSAEAMNDPKKVQTTNTAASSLDTEVVFGTFAQSNLNNINKK